MEKNKGYPQLTGVRSLAASMVFLHHYRPPREIVGPFFFSIFREMHAGVTIFFALSGFLIYLRHSGPTALERRSLIRYAFHRFARIYPMYFLIVVGMGVWTWLAYPLRYPGSQLMQDLALQLTFVRGFSDHFKFIGVGQGWTLTVEVTFYVLFPFLLMLVRRVGFLTTLILVWATGMLLFSFGSLIHWNDFFSPFPFVMIYTFFGRAGDFFAGMFVADRVLKLPPARKAGKKKAKSVAKWRFPSYTVLGVVGIAACLSGLALLEPSADIDGPFNPFGAIIYLLILPPFVGALFYGLVVERTWFSWLLGSQVLVIMGASSYCFYLIHVGGANFLISQWVAIYGLFPGYLGLVAISIILWLGVEEPLRRLVLSHRYFQRTSAASAPA
jgi:peptidoglycan/LPS O-acetylase OafA/YrhL